MASPEIEEEPLKGPPSKFTITGLVIILVAISQGFLGLSDLSMSYLYKDDFGMSPSQVAFASSLASIPWIIKPLWGFISDCFPIFGRRRSPYLAIFGIIGMCAWIYMSSSVNSPTSAVITMLIIQICTAFCNVIGEALVVEESQKGGNSPEDASRYVTLFFGTRALGMLITAYSGGILLEYIDKRTVFLITACFPLLLCAAALLMNEHRVTENPTVHTQIKEIWQFVKMPRVAWPITFIFLFMCTPSSGDAMFFYYTNDLGFEYEFMGRMKMAWGLATLIGMLVYNKWLKDTKFKPMFFWSCIIGCIMGLTQILLVTRSNIILGIPDTVFALSSNFLVQALGELNAMPLLVLCCRICPKNIEGSLYALLMSTWNFGNLISSQLGAVLMIALGITETNFNLLWLMLLLTNFIMLIPLPLLKCIPEYDRVEKEERNSDGYNDV